jgi:hypothetical protein
MRRSRWLDLILAAAGLTFGATSISWPFGWDTSVHYYVGREWVLRGAIPYRDTFDHKSPGIHLVHGLLILLFGEHMWGIRLAELACIGALGWACAAIAQHRRGDGRDAPAGLHGATILVASVLYYGFFDYWNTAQCELLGTTIAAWMVLASLRARTPAGAAIASGLLAGANAVLKPPFAAFAVVSLVVLIARARREGTGSPAGRSARAAALFVLASAAVPLGFLAYFAAEHALDPLVTIVVGANLAYVRDEQRLHSVGEVIETIGIVWRHFCPVASILLATSLLGAGRCLATRSSAGARSWGLVAGLLVVSFAIVAVQLKFYFYDWITCLSAVTLLAANALVDVARLARPARRWVPVIASAVVLAAFTQTGGPFVGWRTSTTAVLHWWHGDWDRPRFASTFETWGGDRKYAPLEAAGLWLRERTAPDDFVLVRGIAVELYVVSGRRAPGRFFWTAFLTRPSRRFHREEWLAEDEATIDRTKPRWVVADAPARSGPESAAWFAAKGYVERTRIGNCVIMERGGPTPATRADAR